MMVVQKVYPDSGSREGKWVALMIIMIVAFSAAILPYHQLAPKSEELLSHQVLLTELDQNTLTIIAQLKLAHEEIRDLFSESAQWPEINELQEMWLAPFVEDQSWQFQGALYWQIAAPGLYLGVASNEQGVATILLDSRHEVADIWFSSEASSSQSLSTLLSTTEAVSLPDVTSALTQAAIGFPKGLRQVVLVAPASSNHLTH
ncbi:DUF6162 family protein [Vibrio sagamiensis]|uniref:Uncharacterized protein n=1 Tax=Vibrio sagamiensis NBRC 104589 TaxID=1219064 RepID=A0A511QD88_9VIBR|nr:hypothetical protein [Vibrio sagamiensis]PNQ68859.1 hypothetical protein C1141_06630 [Vibrio agarivorans]GEM75258.1 hypothetical protein VSA01S_13700 [Vibrio sagamiensis NBRC 104589]